MKRSQNSLYSVTALALFALLGLTACPQDAKEEGKAPPADPAAAAAQPTPSATPTTDPAVVAPTAQPSPTAVSPAAPSAGEAMKADPNKAAVSETKEAAKK